MNKNDRNKHKVILVDDHPLLRKGLAQLINQEMDLVVCGEAEDASTALKLADELEPEVAVVDLSLKDSNGIDLIKDFKIRAPKLLVLVLSMHDENFYAERALRAGARGYVTKGESSTRVIEGIRELIAGKLFLSKAVSARMLSRFVGSRPDPTRLVDDLSDREFEVLGMIGQGLQSREVADILHLSVKTIDAHRENLKRKLGLADASELLKYAIKWVQTEKGDRSN